MQSYPRACTGHVSAWSYQLGFVSCTGVTSSLVPGLSHIHSPFRAWEQGQCDQIGRLGHNLMQSRGWPYQYGHYSNGSECYSPLHSIHHLQFRTTGGGKSNQSYPAELMQSFRCFRRNSCSLLMQLAWGERHTLSIIPAHFITHKAYRCPGPLGIGLTTFFQNRFFSCASKCKAYCKAIYHH